MSNKYIEMRQRQQEEMNDFPAFFAFDNIQLGAGLKKLGLKRTDLKRLVRGIAGMFYLKSDAKKVHKMFNGHAAELTDAIAADPTGEGFIYEMFCTELSNHEYTTTLDISEAIASCGLTLREVLEDSRLLHGLKKASTDLLAQKTGNR